MTVLTGGDERGMMEVTKEVMPCRSILVSPSGRMMGFL